MPTDDGYSLQLALNKYLLNKLNKFPCHSQINKGINNEKNSLYLVLPKSINCDNSVTYQVLNLFLLWNPLLCVI